MTGSGGAESLAPPDGFLPAVYDELRRLDAARLAGKGAGHSLDATDLVHEAYLRMNTWTTN
jgi:ECF sigma factor